MNPIYDCEAEIAALGGDRHILRTIGVRVGEARWNSGMQGMTHSYSASFPVVWTDEVGGEVPCDGERDKRAFLLGVVLRHCEHLRREMELHIARLRAEIDAIEPPGTEEYNIADGC